MKNRKKELSMTDETIHAVNDSIRDWLKLALQEAGKK